MTINLTINNVTDVRMLLYGASSHSFDEGSRQVTTYIYEIQAFVATYMDIGIRIKDDSATIHQIGVDTLTTSHKLRIRKGSTTHGIPLVATTDANATPFYIYDGTSVKALPKVV
jgi:hypothetical protein